jgi:two-component sensor histidine kinase
MNTQYSVQTARQSTESTFSLVEPQVAPLETWRHVKREAEPDPLVELAADNVRLRAALAKAESAGVHRELITQELKHRIGNLLTVVQAIARKSFYAANAGDVDEFNARLTALAAAQNFLIDADTKPTKFYDVVKAALGPTCGDDRCKISGPELTLDGPRAHALTLALHELATNAAKYGALSVDGGWIEVSWSQTGTELDFLWREFGGPPVTTPTRRGFGSRLITNNLGIAFSGEVEVTFNRAGVECRLRSHNQAPA